MARPQQNPPPPPPANPAKLEAAMRFLREVKRELGGRQRPLYTAVVHCLNASRDQSQSTTELRDQVEALLAGYDHLLTSFRAFFSCVPKRYTPFTLNRGRDRDALAENRGTTATDAIVIDDEDDEEVVLVGSKGGPNALEDFPHLRQHCVVHNFPGKDQAGRAILARQHCPNCYCFLCDRPAKSCAHWELHALARDEDAWRRIRDALRSANS